jgi:hypothetical protein
MTTVILFGYETWSFTFRHESRLRIFEYKMLRSTSDHVATD